MNFDFTDDQQAIKRTAKEFLAARFKPDHVRELAEAKRYDEDAWKEMCELGWAGIFIGEEHGGQELGAVELIILMEELAYALAPVPFLSNAAAGLVLQHGGSDEQKSRWLPGLATGELRGTVGWLGEGGEARLVPDAEGADVIVLASSDRSAVVEGSAADIEPFEAMDATRRFARVRIDGGDALGGDAMPGIDRICVALAAESVGISQRAMEMAVEYARDRKQFDRPIGAYQAVSHRCAEMLLKVESSRSAAYYAAWCGDAEPDSLPAASSMAKAYASDAGWAVCAASLQVHGGIGFTWEHDLHFFLKRAKTNALMFGSAAEHRERVAELTGVGAPTAASAAA